MPRPSKMILAHSEQKNLTSLVVTPLYTMADARYIMESSQFSKDTLLSILFMGPPIINKATACAAAIG